MLEVSSRSIDHKIAELDQRGHESCLKWHFRGKIENFLKKRSSYDKKECFPYKKSFLDFKIFFFEW